MMRFLTKILSNSNDRDLATIESLGEDIETLKLELKNQKKLLREYNNILRVYAIANESLCKEVSMIGRWAMTLIHVDSEDMNEFKSRFGGFDTDDDEYLN